MSPSEIQIRQLTPADAESFSELRLEGLRLNPEAFGSTYEFEKDQPLTRYTGWLTNSTVFGAFQNSHLIGTASFTQLSGLKDSHKRLLRAMYVRPIHRRSGAGRQLVQAIIELARQKVEQVQLSVVSDQPTRHPPLPIPRLPPIRPREKRPQAQRPLLRRNPNVPRSCLRLIWKTSFAIGVVSPHSSVFSVLLLCALCVKSDIRTNQWQTIGHVRLG